MRRYNLPLFTGLDPAAGVLVCTDAKRFTGIGFGVTGDSAEDDGGSVWTERRKTAKTDDCSAGTAVWTATRSLPHAAHR